VLRQQIYRNSALALDLEILRNMTVMFALRTKTQGILRLSHLNKKQSDIEIERVFPDFWERMWLFVSFLSSPSRELIPTSVSEGPICSSQSKKQL
jgi:hypothetical protein